MGARHSSEAPFEGLAKIACDLLPTVVVEEVAVTEREKFGLTPRRRTMRLYVHGCSKSMQFWHLWSAFRAEARQRIERE